MQIEMLLAQRFQLRIVAQSDGHKPFIPERDRAALGVRRRRRRRAHSAQHELTSRQLNRMSLIHFHVNESDVAYEAQVGLLQVAAEDAVVEARHEKESGQARLDHAHRAHERAQEAVEEEVEVGEDEVELAVLEEDLLLRARANQKVLAQVPDEYALEEEDGQDGQHDLGQILGDKVEFYEEANDEQNHQRHLE